MSNFADFFRTARPFTSNPAGQLVGRHHKEKQMSNSPVTASLGEQVRMKQGANQEKGGGVDLKKLITASPSAREQRKGSKTPLAPKGFRFTPPTLVRPTLSVEDEEIRRQALAALEEFKAQIGPYMQDLAVEIRRIESFGPDEQAMASGDWDAIQSALAEQLNAADPLAKSLATIAYADAMIRTCPEGRGWVIATLKDLVEKGFLTDAPKPETANGPFRPPKVGQVYTYSRLYSLAPSFVKNEEAQGILTAISDLVGRAVAAGREYYQTHRDETIALAGPPETQLALDQLQNPTCPNGLRHLPVPEQEWTDRDGNRRFRRGGGIVVQVVCNERGPVIMIVAGYGGVERDAEKIRETNAFVGPVSLRHDRIQLNQRVEPAQYWAIQQLHRLVRLGIGEARWQEERALEVAAFNATCRAEREVLVAKTTLTPQEFLLEEKAGSAVIHWVPGAFEWRKFDPATKKTTLVRVWHLFGLFERNEQGRIRVAECPDRLKEFWAGHRDFEVPGQEFSELGKVGVVLRRAKANLLKAAEKAAAGEEANGTDEPKQ